MDNFWKSDVDAYRQGKTFNRKNDNPDSRIVRMSKAAGVDLRPLMHFWGVRYSDKAKVEQEIKDAGLLPSRRIKTLLEHYQDIIPKTNAAFNDHANELYPNGGPKKETTDRKTFISGSRARGMSSCIRLLSI